MTLNLNTVMLGSEDSKALAAFYTKVLGEPNPEWSDDAGGWYGYQAGAGGLAIGPHSEVTGKNQHPGRIMLNFETPEMKAEFARVKELGAEVVAEPYSPMGDERMLMCTFADPDGNYFQFSTPWDPSAS
jgi:predicted enzyme related to lactoylglutathione lyase